MADETVVNRPADATLALCQMCDNDVWTTDDHPQRFCSAKCENEWMKFQRSSQRRQSTPRFGRGGY